MRPVGVCGEASVEFRVLGPVEVVCAEQTLPVHGRRLLALLSLLLLEPGRPVPCDRLVHELWAGSPPAGANATLRSYVSRLRSALGGGAALTGGAFGYALEVEADRVDAHRFERLAREGREALARAAPREAATRLQSALDLWRGAAFAGLAEHGALRLEAERLEQLFLVAQEERFEAELALGRGRGLVEELEALVREQPYRERLWRQLMLALYRAERQADALSAARRARTILGEELGLEPSEELRALERAILRQEVPAARPTEGRHNLPAPVTSFVGREPELSEIAQLLQEGRLLTLTGVGGVGKTRLALETAWRARPMFADGVFFCDLAALVDGALVARHVVTTLDVKEQPGRPVDEHLGAELRDAQLLLVLDNCEHVRDSCAALAQSLLATCPLVRVLATSRRSLGVPGEIDYPVPPLALKQADEASGDRASSEAVQLFLARAREARPRLDEQAAVASAERICRDLDGLPLAIELAAARAKALTVDDIATRLADRFRFLVAWRRLTAARHRTLREAMDWSYGLLDGEARGLLAGLAVFAGGFTLSAAARVCLDGDESRALDLLDDLVDASLVVAEDDGTTMRYRLLETVRQYAEERLQEAGEEGGARERHAAWSLSLAEEAEPHLTGEEQTRWFRILERELDNLRVALAHLGAAGDVEHRLRLAIALSRFWYVRGHLSEGRRWLEQALLDADDREPGLSRRAYTAAASLALLQGDYAIATGHAELALVAARAGNETHVVANALSNLGAIVLAAGDTARASELLEEAVVLAREAGDPRIAALAINNLGDLALTVGDYERAEPLFEESLALLRARGDTANIARSLFNLGAVALELGRLEDARTRFGESLTHAREADSKEDVAWCLEGLAGLAAAEGHGTRAALVLGAAGALMAELEADFKPFERRLHDDTSAEALRLCGPDAFSAALSDGASLPLADAIERALAADGARRAGGLRGLRGGREAARPVGRADAGARGRRGVLASRSRRRGRRGRARDPRAPVGRAHRVRDRPLRAAARAGRGRNGDRPRQVPARPRAADRRRLALGRRDVQRRRPGDDRREATRGG
jgi:predicted ATPase/DNA-binding SARP family transcriptional activator